MLAAGLACNSTLHDNTLARSCLPSVLFAVSLSLDDRKGGRREGGGVNLNRGQRFRKGGYVIALITSVFIYQNFYDFFFLLYHDVR